MPPTNQARIAMFADSLGRCHADPGFITRFYERFVAASPEVGAKFENTDFERQRRAMSASLYALVLAIDGGQAALLYLDQVARQHGRADLDIRPELYDLWLECLIETVREFDPQYSDEIEQAWREAMAFGIKFMQSRY